MASKVGCFPYTIDVQNAKCSDESLGLVVDYLQQYAPDGCNPYCCDGAGAGSVRFLLSVIFNEYSEKCLFSESDATAAAKGEQLTANVRSLFDNRMALDTD